MQPILSGPRILLCPRCKRPGTVSDRSVVEYVCASCGHRFMVLHCPEKLQLVNLGGGVVLTFNLN